MSNNRLGTMQIVDNKEINFATNNSESGCACNTCVYFYLMLPKEADPSVPYKDFSTEELPLVIKPVIPIGACLYLLASTNQIIINIPSNYSCPKYLMRSFEEQFEDDTIGDTTW